MKIQFIAHNGQLYGANQVLLTLAKGLKKQGHEISILIPTSKGLAEILKDEDIEYIVTPSFPQFMYIKFSFKYLLLPLLFILNIISFPIIIAKIKKFNPDIIYSNTSAECLGIWISKILKIKHILHIHEFMSSSYFIGGDKMKKTIVKKSDGLIYVSRSIADYIQLDNFDFPQGKIIYNGLPSPSTFIAKVRPSKMRFGIIGVFTPSKRQDLAIDFFYKRILTNYPSSELHLIGDKEGSYKKYIEKKVIDYKIQEKVIFHGFIKEIENIYKHIDILLVFSESEGFGLVTVEAMLRGIPVIGYNNTGTAELIKDKKTGYLFDNEESFAASLNSLMAEGNYEKISSNALTYSNQEFSTETFCLKIEEFISQIINS